MNRTKWTSDELQEAVIRSTSLAGITRILGVAPQNHEAIKRRIAKLGLDTSHFTGQAWRKGSTIPVVAGLPLEELLVCQPHRSSHLRKRLIREGVFEARCSKCGLTEWLSQPIALELEHIDGDKGNNRLENLCLLCPNCHAQTPTYRGKNIGRYN